jgi:hypothetical protein
MPMRGKFRISAALFAAMIVGALAQSQQPAPDGAKPGLDIVRIRKNIFLLAGAGGNITVSVGPDGVLLVDSGNKDASDQVLYQP